MNVTFLCLAIFLMIALMAHAAPPDPTFTPIGKLATRSASEIQSSSWSIGSEALDRDYGVFANYKSYLGPLGAKSMRVQCGWAKCEKTQGVYNWAWLDEVVDGAVDAGVKPWLQTSYGNPIYPGGGDIGLGAELPRSPEALAAWDRWVQALVHRYKDKVNEWEIWNEPDLNYLHPGMGAAFDPEAYTHFFIRTAEIIRTEQPNARIYGLAAAGDDAFAMEFLIRLKILGKTSLLTAVTIHGYPLNPDDISNVRQMRTMLARFAPEAHVRQGETGSPHEGVRAGGRAIGLADDKFVWSENRQAKWDLRRMLQHHGNDVPFSLFMLSDLRYPMDTKNFRGFNRKGLLLANDDLTIARPKLAYFAAQRVFSLFDDSLQRLPKFSCTTHSKQVSAFGYSQRSSQAAVVTIWFNGLPPAEENAAKPLDVTFNNIKFTRPVYVDLLTGEVYTISQDRWKDRGGSAEFRSLPVGDWPILVADETALLLEKAAR